MFSNRHAREAYERALTEMVYCDKYSFLLLEHTKGEDMSSLKFSSLKDLISYLISRDKKLTYMQYKGRNSETKWIVSATYYGW